jgi:2-polyprenyl-3-methyl-5-hydroxy-6-metoxy-1,4-benzoquinol methylase
MSRSYREALFESYNSTHVAHLDVDDQSKLEYFREHATLNYLPLLENSDRENSLILEIACNKGYLLAALDSFQFKHLKGIDLSPVDVDKAQHLVPAANVSCVDAFEYLDKHAREFDVVIMKAALEHVEKDRVIPLLEKIAKSLKPGGLVIIDVPNMDWILGQHERYMDFTHEVGFTRESLAQVMRQVFAEVKVEKARPAMLRSMEKVARRFVIFWLQIVLRIIGEGASDTWWDARAIVGVGRKSDD